MWMATLWSPLGVLIVTAALVVGQAPAQPPYDNPTDLADVGVGSVAGVRYVGIESADFTGQRMRDAGDINADGIDDFLIGAPKVTVSRPGRVYLIYGATSSPGSVELAALNGTNGVRIDGIDPVGSLNPCDGVGDVNADGVDDFLVAAPSASTGSLSNNGVAYLVYGASSFGSSGTFDLSTLDGTNGVVIEGLADFDGAKYMGVAGIGDFNGDGVADFAVGFANAGDTSPGPIPNLDGAGNAYLIFGSSAGIGSGESLDLANITADQNSDGKPDGVKCDGASQEASVGFAIDGVGDVNGDGVDDVLIGAPNLNLTVGGDEGASFLIYGTTPVPASCDLSALDGTDGVRLEGISPGDNAGEGISSVGDVDGDGLAELLVGAPGATRSGQSYIGESYVVHGSANGIGAGGTLSLSALGSDNNSDGRDDGVVIEGVLVNDQSGMGGGGGDVNGDGHMDILVGSPQTWFGPGEAALIHGAPGGVGVGGVFDLATLDGLNGALFEGIAFGDFTGVKATVVGDINGDGVKDLAISAPNFGNSGGPIDGVGAVYLIHGGETTGSAEYTAIVASADAPPREIGDARVTVDFDGGAAASPVTATVFRSKSVISELGPIAQVADVAWQLETTRTGFTSAAVTFHYTDAEVVGLDENDLVIFTAPTLGGPWTDQPTSRDPGRNRVSTTVSGFSFFALGQSTTVPAKLSVFRAD